MPSSPKRAEPKALGYDQTEALLLRGAFRLTEQRPVPPGLFKGDEGLRWAYQGGDSGRVGFVALSAKRLSAVWTDNREVWGQALDGQARLFWPDAAEGVACASLCGGMSELLAECQRRGVSQVLLMVRLLGFRQGRDTECTVATMLPAGSAAAPALQTHVLRRLDQSRKLHYRAYSAERALELARAARGPAVLLVPGSSAEHTRMLLETNLIEAEARERVFEGRMPAGGDDVMQLMLRYVVRTLLRYEALWPAEAPGPAAASAAAAGGAPLASSNTHTVLAYDSAAAGQGRMVAERHMQAVRPAGEDHEDGARVVGVHADSSHRGAAVAPGAMDKLRSALATDPRAQIKAQDRDVTRDTHRTESTTDLTVTACTEQGCRTEVLAHLSRGTAHMEARMESHTRILAPAEAEALLRSAAQEAGGRLGADRKPPVCLRLAVPGLLGAEGACFWLPAERVAGTHMQHLFDFASALYCELYGALRLAVWRGRPEDTSSATAAALAPLAEAQREQAELLVQRAHMALELMPMDAARRVLDAELRALVLLAAGVARRAQPADTTLVADADTDTGSLLELRTVNLALRPQVTRADNATASLRDCLATVYVALGAAMERGDVVSVTDAPNPLLLRAAEALLALAGTHHMGVASEPRADSVVVAAPLWALLRSDRVRVAPLVRRDGSELGPSTVSYRAPGSRAVLETLQATARELGPFLETAEGGRDLAPLDVLQRTMRPLLVVPALAGECRLLLVVADEPTLDPGLAERFDARRPTGMMRRLAPADAEARELDLYALVRAASLRRVLEWADLRRPADAPAATVLVVGALRPPRGGRALEAAARAVLAAPTEDKPLLDRVFAEYRDMSSWPYDPRAQPRSRAQARTLVVAKGPRPKAREAVVAMSRAPKLSAPKSRGWALSAEDLDERAVVAVGALPEPLPGSAAERTVTPAAVTIGL